MNAGTIAGRPAAAVGNGCGRRPWATPRVAALAAALAATALLTAACGGGSSSTGSSRAGQVRLARALAFAACMRRHGFANFPDDWSGNVGQLLSAGLDPGSPQLNAAFTKCGSWG